jgi:DNA gyrase subunit A
MQIIKGELVEIRSKYGDERRSQIVYSAADMKMEDIIPDDDVLITISHLGYIKRTLLSEFRTQNRGGRGSKGSDIRDDDFVEYLFVASNHNYLLFFTEKGKCFWLRVFEIPEGSKVSKGRAIQNMINIPQDDKVRAFIKVKDLTDVEYLKNNFIIMCTNKGTIKKTSLEAYSRPRQNGINAITIREDERLLEAKLTDGKNEILMALKCGKAIRFNEAKVRPMGRNASGVRGVTLGSKDDEVVGMICLEEDIYDILVVSENGYGKRSKLEDYRITNRGGKGVKTINITEKTGALIAIKCVLDTDDLMIINKSGVIIRLAVAGLRVMGRATQGVKLINLRDNDSIAAVTFVEKEDEEETTTDALEIDSENSNGNDISDSADFKDDLENGKIIDEDTSLN